MGGMWYNENKRSSIVEKMWMPNCIYFECLFTALSGLSPKSCRFLDLLLHKCSVIFVLLEFLGVIYWCSLFSAIQTSCLIRMIYYGAQIMIYGRFVFGKWTFVGFWSNQQFLFFQSLFPFGEWVSNVFSNRQNCKLIIIRPLIFFLVCWFKAKSVADARVYL